MPPKNALTNSFLASADAESEVVCPLQNQDGSQCRKRCTGEKRYRSMQEHIRRAHPDHYIPKLPATEESFQLMINTPPSQRPQVVSGPIAAPSHKSGGTDAHVLDNTLTETPGLTESQGPATANAAVALTQLHQWDSDYEDYKDDPKPERTLGLPSIHDTLPPFEASRTQKDLLPSILKSPIERYASLPPIYRRDKGPRPRKESVGQYARKGKHERGKSKDYTSIKEFTRRFSPEGRKAMSAEPPTAAWMQGKRWEDLIEAATSATEVDDDRDLTPMPQSPNFPPVLSTTGAPAAAGQAGGGDGGGGASKRSSLPPGFRPPSHLQPQHHHHHHHQQYNASPLQRTLTPPPADSIGPNDPEPFPSIESAGSGQNFHMSRTGLPASVSSNENTSPLQHHSHPYQHSQSSSFGSKADLLEIYCANCGRPWRLREAFACTECICGVCSDCVGHILGGPAAAGQAGVAPMRRGCPRCGVLGGKWKRFQLDFR